MILRPYMFTMDDRFTYNFPVTCMGNEDIKSMNRWCIENNLQVRFIQHTPDCYMFYFTNDEDRVAFKLRWL